MRRPLLATVLLLVLAGFSATATAGARSAAGHASVTILNPSRIEHSFQTRNGRVTLELAQTGPGDSGYLVEIRTGGPSGTVRWQEAGAGTPERVPVLPDGKSEGSLYVTQIRY